MFICNPASASEQKQPCVPVALGLLPTLQHSLFTGEKAGQDERETSKASDAVGALVFSVIIYYFAQSCSLSPTLSALSR